MGIYIDFSSSTIKSRRALVSEYGIRPFWRSFGNFVPVKGSMLCCLWLSNVVECLWRSLPVNNTNPLTKYFSSRTLSIWVLLKLWIWNVTLSLWRWKKYMMFSMTSIKLGQNMHSRGYQSLERGSIPHNFVTYPLFMNTDGKVLFLWPILKRKAFQMNTNKHGIGLVFLQIM